MHLIKEMLIFFFSKNITWSYLTNTIYYYLLINRRKHSVVHVQTLKHLKQIDPILGFNIKSYFCSE